MNIDPISDGTTSDLPSPEDRPQADVVIYDGRCRMCRTQIRKLSSWDRRERLAYLSLHDPIVAQRYPDLTHDQLMEEMVVIDRSGQRHAGAAAIRYLSFHLRRLWWVAPLLYFPGSLPLWRFCYRQVAKRRYWLGGAEECDGGTCHLHDRG